jgi:uncharacterized membrane protein/transposase
MRGRQDRDQASLFYEFLLDDMIPKGHLLRRIDVFVTAVLGDLHEQLGPFYSDIGRPSIDPELLIRMHLVGYCFGIRSERKLCEEVTLHLAYRWFCRLDLDDKVPHHSTFSENRLNRFRESDILRHIFERVVMAAMAMGLVKGEGFAVDASVMEANASRYHGKAPDELYWTEKQRQKRAVAEYLAALARRRVVMGSLAHVGTAMTAAFLASLVEAVEALTIVLAVATVRGWRPAGLGALAGLMLLVLIVLAFGPLLDRVPLHLLQLAIGILLLLFGMRWLRKSILRSAGVVPLHDEAMAFATGTAELREQAHRHEARLDWLAALASFKAVLLEGLEVVFIVIALSTSRRLLAPVSGGALAACLLVAGVGFVVQRPLARAGPGARSGSRANAHRALMGIRARRPALGWAGPAGCRLLLQPGPPGRTAGGASDQVPRGIAGRRLSRVRDAHGRRDPPGRVLGAHAAEVLRPPSSDRIADRGRGLTPDRRALCDRDRDSRPQCERAPTAP